MADAFCEKVFLIFLHSIFSLFPSLLFGSSTPPAPAPAFFFIPFRWVFLFLSSLLLSPLPSPSFSSSFSSPSFSYSSPFSKSLREFGFLLGRNIPQRPRRRVCESWRTTKIPLLDISSSSSSFSYFSSCLYFCILVFFFVREKEREAESGR